MFIATVTPAAVFGQSSESGGPLTGAPVLNAPFSADAMTTVNVTLGDGTRISHSAPARHYRDGLGRVRVEQTIVGLEALNLASKDQTRITIEPDPENWLVYTLDPNTRTALKGPRIGADAGIGGGKGYALPVGGVRFLVFTREQMLAQGALVNVIGDEALGVRQIAGVETIGRRVTMTIPAGQIGNDRPMQIVDERWESPELKLVIYARYSDPRTGIIEYRLTNVRRAEPPPELFVIPDGYTLGTATSSDHWITLDFSWKRNRRP